jgi:hypothetical protein
MILVGEDTTSVSQIWPWRSKKEEADYLRHHQAARYLLQPACSIPAVNKIFIFVHLLLVLF